MDQLTSISDSTSPAELTRIANAVDVTRPTEIIEAIFSRIRATENVSHQRINYWALLDRLCKTSSDYVEPLRKIFSSVVVECAPSSHSPHYGEFLLILQSLKHFLGAAVTVAKKKLNIGVDNDTTDLEFQQPQANTRQIISRNTSLNVLGSHVSRSSAAARNVEGGVMARTRDSLLAVKMSNAFVPAMAAEVALAAPQSDVDAPAGYRQQAPSAHADDYRRERGKRGRELMEALRQKDEERSRKTGGAQDTSVVAKSLMDFSDILMPSELPRDEYGVQIGNFPLGVRFLKKAIADCGGVLELETIVQRLSTLADSNEGKDKFGDVRQFLQIHSPTFSICEENSRLVVRLQEEPSSPQKIQTDDGSVLFSWERTTCPLCTLHVKGRNLARHVNCRRCIATQIATALETAPRSPIGELVVCARAIINIKSRGISEGFSLSSGSFLDDDDISYFEACLRSAGSVRRYKFSSAKNFLIVLRAIREVRAKWLSIHAVDEIDNINILPSDRAYVSFFGALGSLVHRLPIAWIEMGDIVDMCRRFSPNVEAAFNPPPRPADPRIQMTNEYPGFLFCDSEIDSEDEISADDDEQCSDDEQEQFEFAAPVSVVETLMTVGFDRDTRRLQHRLRTRPPMVLPRALRTGGAMSLQDAYSSK